jgi:hypothetical protein
MERVIEHTKRAAPPGDGCGEATGYTKNGRLPGGVFSPVPETPWVGQGAEAAPARGAGLTREGLRELADALLEYEMTRGDWAKSR